MRGGTGVAMGSSSAEAVRQTTPMMMELFFLMPLNTAVG